MRKSKKVLENKISILTLDDDPIITSTIEAYFKRSGYDVDIENDPLRAIERIRESSYDILLLDFLMSPICGDQVVERIREFNKELFIVLLTGHKSMAPPVKTIRQLDIQGYYEKNERFDQLELLVESCVKSIKQMRIIKEYQERYPNIVLLDHDQKLGAMGNFVSMLEKVDADYFLFCDQDDVWLKEKVAMSLQKMEVLEEENPGKSVVVFTDLKVVDASLGEISSSFWEYIFSADMQIWKRGRKWGVMRPSLQCLSVLVY